MRVPLCFHALCIATSSLGMAGAVHAAQHPRTIADTTTPDDTRPAGNAGMPQNDGTGERNDGVLRHDEQSEALEARNDNGCAGLAAMAISFAFEPRIGNFQVLDTELRDYGFAGVGSPVLLGMGLRGRLFWRHGLFVGMSMS